MIPTSQCVATPLTLLVVILYHVDRCVRGSEAGRGRRSLLLPVVAIAVFIIAIVVVPALSTRAQLTLQTWASGRVDNAVKANDAAYVGR